MENHYVECSVCKKYFDQGTIGQDFAGFGKRTLVPQRRWHSASEVKSVRFARHDWVCAKCGGVKVERDTQEPLWKRAKAEWAQVLHSTELGALRGKRG